MTVFLASKDGSRQTLLKATNSTNAEATTTAFEPDEALQVIFTTDDSSNLFSALRLQVNIRVRGCDYSPRSINSKHGPYSESQCLDTSFTISK